MKRHLPPLDGLRGIAILWVVWHNAFGYGSRDFASGARFGVEWWLAVLANTGWIGVQLFFVLSGFLITGILLDTQQAPNYYRAFFGRRVLRIFPLYYGALFVFLVAWPGYAAFAGDAVPSGSRWEQVFLWTYLSNWWGGAGGHGFGLPHFWSLAVEEQFYLVWPWIVRRRSAAGMLRFAGWVIAVAAVARIGMRVAGASPEMLYQFTVTRMDALAFGAAAAALVRMPEGRAWLDRQGARLLPWSLALLLGTALVTRLYAYHTAPTQLLGYPVLALGATAVLLASLRDDAPWNRWLGSALSMRWLRHVGTISYGMYVYHVPILRSLAHVQLPHAARALDHHPVQLGLATLLVSYAAAFVSYVGIERRILDLKRHFTARVPVTATA